jgi:hypothetical protein
MHRVVSSKDAADKVEKTIAASRIKPVQQKGKRTMAAAKPMAGLRMALCIVVAGCATPQRTSSLSDREARLIHSRGYEAVWKEFTA